MKIRILKTKSVPGVGHLHKDTEVSVDDGIARDLIRQGVAEKAQEKPKPPTKED